MSNISRTSRFASAIALLLLLTLTISSCTQSHPPYVANPAAPQIRVCLLERQPQIMLSATEPPIVRLNDEMPGRRLNIPPGSSVAILLTPAGWQIGNIPLPIGVLTIVPATDGTVSINNKRYHGKYRLVPVKEGFDVVNDVDIDAYLKGVLADEMLKGWLPETYKAQAITARTYALYEARTTSPGKHFDVFDDTRSQVYGGISSETAKARQAVDETSGVVVVYGPPGQEKIFKAYFSSCCGGISQSAADAFNEAYIPPLSDQNNHSLCAASPRFNYGPITISKTDLTARIRTWGDKRKRPERNIAEVASIAIQANNRWGRPTRFVVTDTTGNRYSLTGEELRWAVNTNATDTTRLSSSFLKPITQPDTIQFIDCHGNGHGVGLCQWCSQARAEAGMRHEDIVLSAFQRAKLARAY
ncbi:MAG TPA: SpoIID/LytB domain-containing protein [Tepidisphaeraceae bacterium]|jgi:stage II sporulation protein D